MSLAAARRRHALAAGALVLALAPGAALAGCGESGGSSAGGAPSSRLVDPTKPPPLVNALDIDPATQEFLLTTNRGFFRIGRESGRVRRVGGTVRAGTKTASVGSFLQVAVTGPGSLVGSGHPDREGTLPQLLGVIGSADGGRTWRVLSRLGRADLHKIVLAHDRMYAFDAVIGALLVSRDGGRTFSSEQYTPGGAAIGDFEVDPGDARRIVAASDVELYRSADGGAAWERIGRGAGVRLAWPAHDALYRALKDGSVQVSADGGTSWSAAARVGGEPYRFKAVSRDELYLALGDGTIVHTRDGARTWEEAFRP
ncbi:MAG: hypothetical protein QOI64_978 [Solirubrobacteraceae bacterium]|nr:hypothetical protein [Solirubrobacteraceae bacterium]